MSFIPYSCQNIDASDIAAVTDTLNSAYLTQGPAVPVFEKAFATRHQADHAVAVANATAGLHIACLALGVGPGSRVWTSPNSFIASANCALYCGANIDFVDIDPVTRNMSLQALEQKLTQAAKNNTLPAVVIPVDFAGLPCDLKQMRELADRYHFSIIEDASHAIGAEYLGKPTGSAYADITIFSMHAVKIITTAEGGVITTKDDALAKKLRLLRSQGITRESADLQYNPEGPWVYEQQLLGFNYRLTDIQAALGSSQLRKLDAWLQRRTQLADRYDELLAGLPLKIPARLSDRRSSWHLYAVELDSEATRRSRYEVYMGMQAAQIGVNVHYIPIHTQPYYRALGFAEGDFPNAERYYSRAISIPLFPSLTDTQQEYVASTLRTLLSV